MGILNRINSKLAIRKEYAEAAEVFDKFKDFTMVPKGAYMENLILSKRAKDIKGAIVECGVWRGGMIGGIASLLGADRKYFLYDSYEGLPEVGEWDGQKSKDYQANKDSSGYQDNCKAEISFAQSAMKLAGVENANYVKGWFNQTAHKHNPKDKIALLRLDGDWYESTMDCLKGLYDHVVEGGIIILDDYHTWDGCARAVHDFLSERKLPLRIREYNNVLCYIEKKLQ